MKYKWTGWTSEFFTHIISWNSICCIICIIVVSLSLGRFYPGHISMLKWRIFVMWATKNAINHHKISQSYQTFSDGHQEFLETLHFIRSWWTSQIIHQHSGGWFCNPTHQASHSDDLGWFDCLTGVCAAPHPLAKRGSKGWGRLGAAGGWWRSGQQQNLWGFHAHFRKKLAFGWGVQQLRLLARTGFNMV